MKIIISHDIDHLSAKEHLFKDLIIPKYFFWSFLELIKRKVYFETFLKKITGLVKKNAWNNLEELLEFDKKNGTEPTFFIAVNNGKGLSYSREQVAQAINLIKKYNFDIGVHGICYNNYEGIKKEYNIFKGISGLDNFGIRMHYLRRNQETLKNLAKAGYLFDTTILSDSLEQKYKIDGMAEVPFHFMDSYFLGPQANLTLEKVKSITVELLDKGERGNKGYLGIQFHQERFSDEFPQFKEWYIWFINYCKERGYLFENYRNLLYSN